MDTKFFDGIFGGDSPNGVELCLGLTGGDFWTRIEGCQNLYRGQAADTIDSENIIVTIEPAEGLITVPSEIVHFPGESYVYLLRKVNIYGDEEKSFCGATRISFDDNGDLIATGCNEILEVDIEQVGGPKVKLTWFYSPLGQTRRCQQFKVYSDGASGQIDFNNAVASIEYEGACVYCYVSAILNEGRYKFCLRSVADDGQETTGKEIKLSISEAVAQSVDQLYVGIT